MDIRQKTLQFIKSRKTATSSDVVTFLGISRQYAARLLKDLVKTGVVAKIGSTRGARYVLPQFADDFGRRMDKRRFRTNGLEEHMVLEEMVEPFSVFRSAPENIQSILRYAFSEMLNNAIEHSKSPNIEVELLVDGPIFRFIVNDFGIGVFRNVMRQRHLASPFEAMQDLLKGKTTTDPRAHSGEGIFFTSKVADRFVLESFGHRLIIDNTIPDVFFGEQKPSKRGTRVIFSIDTGSKRHLNDVFRVFQSKKGDYAFDMTKVHVRLFTMGTIYISRSQARRILSGLEKFKVVTLDFERVPTVGQAFADEVFRVFKNQHPKIKMTPINMNSAVKFMIERARKEQ
jgi:anti-sigma regulatory factor (Ser/Thr protein kinase)